MCRNGTRCPTSTKRITRSRGAGGEKGVAWRLAEIWLEGAMKEYTSFMKKYMFDDVGGGGVMQIRGVASVSMASSVG